MVPSYLVLSALQKKKKHPLTNTVTTGLLEPAKKEEKYFFILSRAKGTNELFIFTQAN